MISKREFGDVVNQVNGRFDWCTAQIKELQAELEALKNPTPKAAKEKAAPKVEAVK
tara:strand:- start:3513 stop:3680 length:168 start_codon:yes stop_codon:yes gene_type:complete